MSDERILEVIEKNDKYYILGFINGIKADRDILKQENAELKKQLQIKAEGFKAVNEELCEYAEENEKLKTQQQQFIDYLEDNWKQTQDIWYVKILNKYNEIIGKKIDENNL